MLVNRRVSGTVDLGDGKRIGRSRWAALKQICDTLVIELEHGAYEKLPLTLASVRELDKQVQEIESVRQFPRPKYRHTIYTPEEISAKNRRAVLARWAKRKSGASKTAATRSREGECYEGKAKGTE